MQETCMMINRSVQGATFIAEKISLLTEAFEFKPCRKKLVIFRCLNFDIEICLLPEAGC